MKNKKAQAAMEFLMTYGWAILAAVIAVAALWWLMSSSGANINLCTLNAPLSCEGVIADATANTITVGVINGAGESITLSNVTIANCGTNSDGATVANGATESVSITCNPALSSGQAIKESIQVRFTKGDSTFEQASTGTISTEAL